MIFRALARVFALLHVAFAIFVVFGALLVVHWPGLMWVHLLAILWAAATLSLDLGCPLTAWEKSCSRRGGVEPYPEGFVAHYIALAGFAESKSHVFHIVLGACAIVLNVIVYAFMKHASS